MTREVQWPHPGEILLEEWLKPMALSQYALAKAIDVPPRRINEIGQGVRGITADTALRLAAFFVTDAPSWLNLQSDMPRTTGVRIDFRQVCATRAWWNNRGAGASSLAQGLDAGMAPGGNATAAGGGCQPPVLAASTMHFERLSK